MNIVYKCLIISSLKKKSLIISEILFSLYQRKNEHLIPLEKKR